MPVVLCCAGEDADAMVSVVAEVSAGGGLPEVLGEIDEDPRLLGEALDQLPGHAFVGVFVGSHLTDGDLLRIRGIFGARRGPFHELFVLRTEEDFTVFYERLGVTRERTASHIARGAAQEPRGPFSGMRRAWRRRRSTSYVPGAPAVPSEDKSQVRIDPLQAQKREDPAAQLSLSSLTVPMMSPPGATEEETSNSVDVVGNVAISAAAARDDLDSLIRETTSEVARSGQAMEASHSKGSDEDAREWSIGKMKERDALQILGDVGPLELPEESSSEAEGAGQKEEGLNPRSPLVLGLVAVGTLAVMVGLMSLVVGDGLAPTDEQAAARGLSPQSLDVTTAGQPSGTSVGDMSEESGAGGASTTGDGGEGTANRDTAARGTAGSETSGDTTAGRETTEGETTAGETTAGATTEGETTEGETTEGETTEGETTEGDTTSGDGAETRVPPPRLRPRARLIDREQTDKLLSLDEVVGSGTLRVGVGWADAHAICRENKFQGYDQFRIPTFDELMGLAQQGYLDLGSAHWSVSVAKGSKPGFVRAVLNGEEVKRETEFDVAAVACVRSKNTVPRNR